VRLAVSFSKASCASLLSEDLSGEEQSLRSCVLATLHASDGFRSRGANPGGNNGIGHVKPCQRKLGSFAPLIPALTDGEPSIVPQELAGSRVSGGLLSMGNAEAKEMIEGSRTSDRPHAFGQLRLTASV
jgi:hypothetical protein